MKSQSLKRSFLFNFPTRLFSSSTKLGAFCFSALISCQVFALSTLPDNQNTTEQKSVTPPKTILECDEDCMDKFNRLKKFARNGSPEAQTLLAISYRTGEMSEVDPKRAWKWIKYPVRLRYAPALHIISQWHREGFETEVNIEKADEYLERAAKLGFSPAVYDLAILHYDQKDYQKSIELFESAAKLGNPDAKRVMTKLTAFLENANGNGKSGSASTEQSEAQHGDDQNVLTIVGSQEPPIVLFENFYSQLKDLNIYNRRGVTGSRLGFRKCGEPGTSCNVLFNRSTDSVELMEASTN